MSDDEPFATLDLFARVEAAGARGHRVGGADGLGVDQPRTRLGVASVGVTDLTPQAHSVRTTQKIASTIRRRGCFSLRPPFGPTLAGGSNGATSAHCSSVRSDGYPPPAPLKACSTTTPATGHGRSQTRSQRPHRHVTAARAFAQAFAKSSRAPQRSLRVSS